MADIHQWRRMIQPARSRTPGVGTDEPDNLLSPTTPRKGLKPKLSSYFTQHAAPTAAGRFELSHACETLPPGLPAWPTTDAAPNPDPERLIDSVMNRLLAGPDRPLDSRFNGILLEIFESFRNLTDEKTLAQSHAQTEIEKRLALERTMREAAEQWDREKQIYKAEIKRLELLLSKGARGLAEVTLARQNSMLRCKRGNEDDVSKEKTLESIFEFLERSRRNEEKIWTSQRATMKNRPISPSVAMRRLSSRLTASINVYEELNLDITQPTSQLNGAFATKNAGTRDLAQELHRNDIVRPPDRLEQDAAFANQGLSPFSSVGDLLPDEDDEAFPKGYRTSEEAPVMQWSERLPAKRRINGPARATAKLRDFVVEHSSRSCVEEGNHRYRIDGLQHANDFTFVKQSNPEDNFARHPRLKNKALAFFAKPRPLLDIDTSAAGRRFSFEAGDDHEPILGTTPLYKLPAAVKDRLLRKSVSLSYLSDTASAKRLASQTKLSPVQQSPTASVPPSDTRKSTRIPTPVYSSSSLARPREQREDSASSLLTAIRHADDVCRISVSRSSSGFSSPNAICSDVLQDSQAMGFQEAGFNSVNSNALLDHTNALRGNAFAIAAARAATASSTPSDRIDAWLSSHPGQINAADVGKPCRRSTQHGRAPDACQSRKENVQPISVDADADDLKSNATI